MKKITLVSTVLGFAMCIGAGASAQGFMKKLRDKAADVTNKVVDKKIDQAVGVNDAAGTNNPSNNSANGGAGNSSKSGRPTNKVGEGLKNTTPPDVNQQITEAETANAAGNFSDARYSIQQALLGIEIQMGKEILKSLPQSVVGLAKDTLEDRVTSTQWGWANLMIQRMYKKDEKQLAVLVGNNSAYAGFMNILFAGNLTESNGQTQDFKQIKVKGNKAVIKYDQSTGYTVLVQIGQSGMITFDGVNFATEQDMMSAVNVFDIDGIKKMLGEK
ncbi:MAG: hypothetical protein M3040_12525 [Bacteroidota bacterium]|nr:hypothetical protein [Bacteroidota bacterium]